MEHVSIDAPARQQRKTVTQTRDLSITSPEESKQNINTKPNGFDVSVLVVVNGIRGQYISFFYPDTKVNKEQQTDLNQIQITSSSHTTKVLQSAINSLSQGSSQSPTASIVNASLSSSPIQSTPISHHQQQTSAQTNQQQHMVSQPLKLDSFDFVFDLHAPALSYLLCPPKNNISDKLVSVTIDDLLFISRPTNLRQHKPVMEQTSPDVTESKPRRAKIISKSLSETGNTPTTAHRGDYTDYSIVFVFGREEVPEDKIPIFSQLLTLLMKTYVREEKRCQYVSNQLAILGKIKDSCKDWRGLIKSSYDKSLLAQELIKVVDSIRKGQPLQLRVNNWIEIGFKVPKQRQNPHYTYHYMDYYTGLNCDHHDHHFKGDWGTSTTAMSDSEEIKSFPTSSPLNSNIMMKLSSVSTPDGDLDQFETRNRFSPSLYIVKPYYACIKVKDLPKLKVPPDGLDDVQKVFNLLTPLKTLQDISREYNLTLDFVSSVAQHLVNWGVVRPIPRLTNSTVLVLAADEVASWRHTKQKDTQSDSLTTFLPTESSIKEFAKSFPTMPSLIEMLQVFSIPKTYRQHLDTIVALKNRALMPHQKVDQQLRQPVSSQTEQAAFAQAVVWLLRKDYIKPLRTFIQLAIPSPSLPHHYYHTHHVQPHSHHHHPLHYHHQIRSSLPQLNSQYSQLKAPKSQQSSSNTEKSLTSYEVEYLKSISDDKYLLELFKRYFTMIMITKCIACTFILMENTQNKQSCGMRMYLVTT
jgi:hypothetical protein